MAILSDPFIDTSVLVSAVLGRSRPMFERRLMERIFDEEVSGAMTAWHCLLEFYSVMTRLPGEYRVTPSDAETMVDDFQAILGVHALPSGRRGRFFRQASRRGVEGGRLYDFHIGEIARSLGATVVITNNVRDFAHLQPDLRVLTAEQALNA